MKRIFTLAFIILLTLAQQLSYAQQKFEPEWSFGVNAGATMSRISFSPRILQTMLIQPTGGISVRYISEKNVGLLAELNYSMRGWQLKQDSLVNKDVYARSISYLELPFMTHIYIESGKRVRFFINLGPQIGYYLGAKELDRDIKSDETYYDMKVKNKFDYGIVAGAGIELKTGIGRFALDGRYYFGLSDVFGSTRSDVFQRSSNQVIGVKLVYYIPN